MAQQVKCLLHKPHDLSLILRTHKKVGENLWPAEAKSRPQISGNWSHDPCLRGSELPRRHWKLNPGPLKEQPRVLIMTLSLLS